MNNNRNYFRILNYILIIVLFILSNIYGKNIGLFTFAYCFLTITFIKKDSIIPFILFLLPNIRILDATGYSFLINVLILFSSLKYISILLFKEQTFWINKKSILLLFTILFFSIINLNSATELYAQIFNIINIFFDATMMLIIIQSEGANNKKNNKYYIASLIIGIFSSFLTYIVCNPNFLNMHLQNGLRLSAFGNDPNYFSCFIIIGIALIVKNSIEKSNMKLSNIIALSALTILGLLTSSKMFFIVATMLFILLIINLIHSKYKNKWLLIIVVAIIPLLACTLFKPTIMPLTQSLISRFDLTNHSTAMGNITTGRSEIISDYIKESSNNPRSLLLGRGVNYLDYYKSVGIHKVAHNTYLDILLSWGLLGGTSAIVIFISIIKKLNDRNKIHFNKLIPLIGLLLTMLSLSCLTSDMFWYLLSISIVCALEKGETVNVKD